jgi:hypothetical protein
MNPRQYFQKHRNSVGNQQKVAERRLKNVHIPGPSESQAKNPSLSARWLAPKTVETKIEEINEAWMQAYDVENADVASNSDKQLGPDRKITIWHDRKEKYFTKWVDENYITPW